MFEFIKNFIKKQKRKIMQLQKGDLKVGDKIVPFRNIGSHDYCIDKMYVVHEIRSDNFRAIDPETKRVGNYLRYDEVRLAAASREYFIQRIEKLESELTEIRSKVRWMDEVGTDEFDETEHKVWSVLNAVETEGLSKIERVKLIASIVKG
jgi:predicted neuraminidase